MCIEMGPLAKFGLDALGEHYPVFATALLLTAIFLFGYLEAAVLKWRTSAGFTWFCGLAALSGWIASPLTTLRICLGATTFILGLALIAVYFRKAD